MKLRRVRIENYRSIREADFKRRSQRLRQAPKVLLHPNTRRQLQPRLGHCVRERQGQTLLLNRRNQRLNVLNGTPRD